VKKLIGWPAQRGQRVCEIPPSSSSYPVAAGTLPAATAPSARMGFLEDSYGFLTHPDSAGRTTSGRIRGHFFPPSCSGKSIAMLLKSTLVNPI